MRSVLVGKGRWGFRRTYAGARPRQQAEAWSVVPVNKGVRMAVNSGESRAGSRFPGGQTKDPQEASLAFPTPWVKRSLFKSVER